MKGDLQSFILKTISASKARFFSIGGGSINETFRIESPAAKFFCKINDAYKFPDLFQKEQNGLLFIRKTNTIKVPEVIWCGEYEGKQILILEWIEQGLRTTAFWKKFGAQLSVLHKISSEAHPYPAFGFYEDNYMGALLQNNTHCNNWVEFFIHCRLQPQLKLAERDGLITSTELDQFERLYKKLHSIFPVEKPSALHGDLWSGNYLCDAHSNPVLIDPAVYYGHRSIDLGMTKLFGGFDEVFYTSYHDHFPLPNNFNEQADVCNLYPLLIHLNLFGSSYLSSIVSILKRYG